MWRSVTLAVLAVLAGCGGFVTEAGDPSARDTVTPAPVPGTNADIDVPESNGTVDIERVVDGHRAALADRSFYRRLEQPDVKREVWVDRDRGAVRVRQDAGDGIGGVVVVDGIEYRHSRSTAPANYTTRQSDGDVPYVLSLSGAVTLRQFLTRYEYRQVGTVQRRGNTLVVLEANATGVPLPSPNPNLTASVRSRLYVDRNGIVRDVVHREQFTDGTGREFRMVVRPGRERIDVPWWLDEGDVYPEGESRRDSGQGSA